MNRRLAALFLVLAGLVAAWIWRGASKSAPTAPKVALAVAVAGLERRETEVDQHVWAPEVEAERFEDVFNGLWDKLNVSGNGLALLRGALPVIRMATAGGGELLPHGIRRFRVRGGSESDAARFAATAEEAGWVIRRSRWRMVAFTPGTGGHAPGGKMEVSANLERAPSPARAWLTATLGVVFEDPGGPPSLKSMTLVEATLLVREGVPPFQVWLDEELPLTVPPLFDPLLAMDFEGKGRMSLMLVGADRIWRLAGTAAPMWTGGPFLGLPYALARAAALVDVDGDGRADLLLAESDGLRRLRGNPGGFDAPGDLVWRAPEPLRHPQVIAAGDADGDGAVDLFIGQYKLPYQGGQFPTPYDDANDGFPSYYLHNDAHGGFVDATEAGGLAAKRHRRTYSASFLDIRGKGRPDLIVVSDFAGLDLWQNDGSGRFFDRSAVFGDARLGFGMAHAIADLDGDGRPDVLMLGMDSATVMRMDALGLSRAPGDRRRGAMAWGNRLFLSSGASSDVGLTAADSPIAEAVRRTGWSWGATWADLDNDGRLDLLVAAGHETRPSSVDYERQFWRHDIYDSASARDTVHEAWYGVEHARRQASGASYGGWQDNACRLQAGPGDFIEAAWLLGLTTGADTHNLLVADFDGDGRLDVAMTTFEEWPRPRRRLVVFKNRFPDAGNYIEFRAGAGAVFTPGTRVEVQAAGAGQSRWVVPGEGYRSQAASHVHFGLGSSLAEKAEIQQPNRPSTTLRNPSSGVIDPFQTSR
jgi:enediyne biosynthesis protein E4